jgi:hypothetical protein
LFVPITHNLHSIALDNSQVGDPELDLARMTCPEDFLGQKYLYERF